ncbi:glycosyltransferase [Spiribacter pallidus]|uniref:Glycosyltransferase n=2 Tax=Spiribacter pallidus TaxID=1987936 RepID=A0ABV3TCL9_9GAMM
MFSFVTINKNNALGLEKTLDGFVELNKYFSDFEVVVVDGLSGDNTQSVIAKYRDVIDSWRSERDKGIYDAMTKGTQRVRGKYICFMNSGDQVIPRAMAELMRIQENESFAVAGQHLWENRSYGASGRMWPRLLKMPSHQTIWFPTRFCVDNPFDLTLAIGADLDQKLKALNSIGLRFYKMPVAICELGGVSHSVEGIEALVSRSNDQFIIARRHFGLTWGIINWLKCIFWTGGRRLLPQLLPYRK